ncbi:MAG TPA: 2-dehydropantoate 2-reductase [Desulforhopalus sp.]|nr:2-dehydropantoate 2-reductase [Desulforhopalus sp.]
MSAGLDIVLAGPGALGCLVASLIGRTAGGHRLTILDHRPARAAELSRQGLFYYQGDHRQRVALQVVSEPDQLARADIVVLCVKSSAVISCLERCRPLLGRQTLLVFLQNGIGHLEVADHCGDAAVAYGTTSQGATLLAPGTVRHAGVGHTFLGFLKPPPPPAAELLGRFTALLTAAGMATVESADILSRLWAKLFVNVGINALTATLDCNNGALLELPGVRQRMMTAVSEAWQVAEAQGITVADDPWQMTETVCRQTAGNISSMLQDIRRQRPTEIGAINGAVVELGRRLAVATPENLKMTEEVLALEATYLKAGERDRR